FSIITDEQLDTITKLFKQSKVNSGLQYLTGFLSQHDIKIQCWRVRESLGWVDNMGKRLCEKKLIARQPYKVARPNAMWHLDGHISLFVIHGAIDG
ncbi:hypothetical protein BDP27DRAFT_1173601, partial [Rhodocollybia butyracea]